MKIHINKREFEIIRQIIEENNISYFSLIQEEGGGIGYNTTIHWDTEFNGRMATVSMIVVDHEEW